MDTTCRLSRPQTRRYLSLLALCVLAVLAFLLWNHPDIEETARHTRILLEDLFHGRFFSFYEDTMAGRGTYGYSNAAHYHIAFYLLCAIWNLPLYLLDQLVSVPDLVFVYWTKLISAGAWILSGLLLGALGRRLKADARWCNALPLCFWLCPVAFFTVLAMGQYDSVCLVFLLWALLLYLDDRMIAFTMVMGLAIVCKMFALFLVIPLLLLREKRILRLAGYGLLSLWLYLPGTVLFWHRDGDASFFNSLIADRLFVTELPFAGGASLFLVLLALLYAVCWAWPSTDLQALKQRVPYLCLTVFALLFLCVDWHPQWLILLTPFLLLTTAQSRHPLWWSVLQTILAASFFVLVAYRFPGQIEGNLFTGGVLGQWLNLIPDVAAMRTNTIYFSLVPYLSELAPVGFSAVLLASLIGKLPLANGTLEQRFRDSGSSCSPITSAWLCWLIAFGGFWLVPTLYGWLRSLGI